MLSYKKRTKFKKKEKISPLFDKTVSVKKQPDLKTKLDRIFSEFIRLRDANPAGYTRCISCGKLVPWKQADCGHFVNRSHMATRFNEKNCNAQCHTCNRFDEGNNIGYTEGLIKKYGPGIITELRVLKSQISKLSEFEYKVLIKEYTLKLKQLHADKGI